MPFLLMKKNGYKKSRKEFLRNMAYQLVGPGATRRHELNKRLPIETKSAAQLLGDFFSNNVLKVGIHVLNMA